MITWEPQVEHSPQDDLSRISTSFAGVEKRGLYELRHLGQAVCSLVWSPFKHDSQKLHKESNLYIFYYLDVHTGHR